jgi:hypothetical protein
MNLFNLSAFFLWRKFVILLFLKNPKQHGRDKFLEKFKKISTFLGKMFGNHQDL